MTAQSDSPPPLLGEPDKVPAARPARGRWQFSLRGLLLFVLLVAMGLSLFVTVRRLWRAENKLAEYRREYAILEVEDPKKLNVVACWTPEPGRWRWHAHFPPGRYSLSFATKGITDGDFPKPDGDVTDDLKGLGDISAVIYKDPRSGAWTCAIQFGSVTTYPNMPASLMEPKFSSESGVRWHGGTEVIAPEEPLVLLRKRVAKGSEMLSSQACDGLMLWIRRLGEPTGGGSVARYGSPQ
jgi:hypothetical protein